MEDSKLLKRIDELEKQVQELLKKDKLNMFGSSHDTVGSITSDLVLKTSGKIKVQWRNKFIDLLKDGKINVDTDVIYKVSDKNSIGSKTGIYVTDNREVYLKPKSGDPINLIGEVGTTYVSFLEPQETTSDNKHTALVNVGFLYPDINSISENSLKNGIIYVESEQKLYHVKNGELSEYVFKFPNPFTEQFIISKNDNSQGSLLIVGKGIENSVAFDSLFIYNSDTKSVIDSKIPISFRINNNEFLNISSIVSEFKNDVIADTFKSSNYSSNSGFKLYCINGKSILEVDQIIERDAETIYSNYPEYWIMDNNTVINSDNEDRLLLNFAFPHSYQVGDILRVYYKEEPSEDDEEDPEQQLVDLKVSEVVDNKSVYIDGNEELILNNKLIFKVYPGTPIRIKENNVDLVQYSENLEETILMRFGSLDELNLQRNDLNGDTSIKGLGFYSNQGVFKEIQYSNDYILPEDDNSSRLASTEWIANKLLPIGSIIMFNGTTIPDGWHICDGTEGTPNLIGKFIKADSTSGNTGGSNSVTLSSDNLPPHSHSISNSALDSIKSKLVPAYDEFYENTFDLGGDKHYVVESGYEDKSDKGLVGIKVEDLTGTVSTTGNGDSFDIQPEYYTLMFIMKIK